MIIQKKDLVILFYIILSLCLTSCKTPPSPTPPQKNKAIDKTPPKIIDLQIKTEASSDSSKTLPKTIKVTGQLIEINGIRKLSINEQDILFRKEKSKNTYNFESQLDLLPGLNTFVLLIEDTSGNIQKKTISHQNGTSPTIYIELEKEKLPPLGKSYFNVYMNEEGKKIPLPIKNVKLKAQYGYIKGLEYQAPTNIGIDVITAKYPPNNGLGKTEISIISPKMQTKWEAKEHCFMGDNEKIVIHIKNIGNIEALQTKLIVNLPENVLFQRASQNSNYIGTVRQIHWDMGTLGVGVEEEAHFWVLAQKNNSAKYFLSLESSQQEIIKDSFAFKIKGDIQLQHKCNRSLVRLEEEVTIERIIKANQKLFQLKIEQQFPKECKFIHAEMNFISGHLKKEQTQFSLSGNTIEFEETPSLLPGEEIIIKTTLLIKRYGNLEDNLQVNFIGRDIPQKHKDTFVIPTAK